MFIPKRRQFSKWSVPSKWSYIGGILALSGLFLAIYFWLYPRSNNKMQMEEMEVFANVVIDRVLDGSSLCCDIKTGEIIIFLDEPELLLNASMLIGFKPDSIDDKSLTFSFSLNQKDSFEIFNCSDVGRRDVDVYFFRNRKIFCSKPAIVNLIDTLDLCGN